MDWIYPALALVISAIISVVFTLIYAERLKKAMGEDLLKWQEAMEDYMNLTGENLETMLKPILDTNSRVMGIIASKGQDVKKGRKAMELLGEDIIDQNELLLTGIDTVSPKLAEYLRGNPDQIVGMMPRIMAIAEKAGIDLSQFGLPSPSSRAHQPHPFKDEI